jgi:conjugal transfer mating pair stabilization protein TraG
MAIQLPIAVYGNGDMYQGLFNAIAASMGDSVYGTLINIAILLTGTWAIVRYSAERSLLSLGKWLLTYYIAFFVVFAPKATVEIIDEVNQGQVYSVGNIPLGLAAVASFTSSIGAGLTALLEETFTLPNDMLYGQTGMVMASRLVLASSDRP